MRNPERLAGPLFYLMAGTIYVYAETALTVNDQGKKLWRWKRGMSGYVEGLDHRRRLYSDKATKKPTLFFRNNTL